MALAQLSRRSGFSRVAPPSLITNFISTPPLHPIHTLHSGFAPLVRQRLSAGFEGNVNGRENATRNRQQMRREGDLLWLQIKLFEQFARVPVPEDAIRRKIVCRMHKMCLRGGDLAGSGDAGLRIAYDATVKVNPALGYERPERKNDRS